jgi:hypothetical protein
MNKTDFILLFALLICFSSVCAQEYYTDTCYRRHIGGEIGITNFFGDDNNKSIERLRESKSSDRGYYYDKYYGDNEDFTMVYAGAKVEQIFGRYPQFGISSGLRLSMSFASLHSPDNSDFFWLLKEEGTTTDYVRLKSFSEHSFFVGIPVELRYLLSRRPRVFQTYFKIGAVANFRIATANSVKFSNQSMSKYEKEICSQIKPDGIFNLMVNPAFGFKIGRNCNPLANLEFQVPFFAYGAKNVSSLIYPEAGMNFNISLQFPF